MTTLGSLVFRLVSKGFCLATAAVVFTAPAGAGVVDGVKTVDGLTVYLGTVPAAVTRAHAPQHLERTMHGGISRPTIHDVHLLVAIFNSASGERLKNVSVRARIHGAGKNRGTVPLSAMIINGAYAYGGYTSFGLEEDLMISIDIRRPGRTPRTNTVTAQFEYIHD